MLLDRLHTVDGTSSSHKLSGRKYDFMFEQNGIKMNKLKTFIVKVNKYDILWWFFIWLSDCCIFLLKQYLSWDQANLFENYFIGKCVLDLLIISLLYWWSFQLLQIVKSKLFEKIKENFSVRWKVIISHFGPCSVVNIALTISWKCCERFPYGTVFVHKLSSQLI